MMNKSIVASLVFAAAQAVGDSKIPSVDGKYFDRALQYSTSTSASPKADNYGFWKPEMTNANWSYQKNGQDWDQFSSTCGGSAQSPINIVTEEAEQQVGNYQIRGNGFEEKASGTMTRDYTHRYRNSVSLGEDAWVEFMNGVIGKDEDEGGNKMTPMWAEFHTPSEHQLDGKNMAMEMQIAMAMKGETDVAAVMSIFFDSAVEGKSDKQIEVSQGFVDSMRLGDADDRSSASIDYNMKEFLNGVKFSPFYYYEGSLTMPPCTEKIQWIISGDVQSMSADQTSSIGNRWNNVGNSGLDMLQSSSSTTVKKCTWSETSTSSTTQKQTCWYGQNGVFATTPGQGNNREIQELGSRKVFVSPNQWVKGGLALQASLISVSALLALTSF